MLYDYHCQACGKNFDKLTPIKDRDSVSCPDCGAKAERKLPTGTRHVWVGPPEWASAWKQGKVF